MTTEAVAVVLSVLALLLALLGSKAVDRRRRAAALPPRRSAEWHQAMRELDELDGTRPPRLPELEPPEPMVIHGWADTGRVDVTSFDDKTTVYLTNEPSYDQASRWAPRLMYQRPPDPGRRSRR